MQSALLWHSFDAWLGVPLPASLRALIAAGAGGRDTTMAAAGTLERRAYPLRLGLGWRARERGFGAPELRASAVVVVERAHAARDHDDAIVGAGAAALWALPIARTSRAGATLLVGGGVDGFATALDYRLGGAPVVATPRVAWWAGVGLAGEVGR